VPVDDAENMTDARKNVIIHDVRDKNELEEGRILGSINNSRGILEFKVGMAIPGKIAKNHYLFASSTSEALWIPRR